MDHDQFLPPNGAFTRSVPVRFSHCDPAGIVYFPHYFDMFNGLIEDWYTQELGYNYATLIVGSRYGFPFVHIECDFKRIPSRIGDVIDLTLLVEAHWPFLPAHRNCRPPCWARTPACQHGHRHDVARNAQARAIAAGAARCD